jgi:hypothetical protein
VLSFFLSCTYGAERPRHALARVTRNATDPVRCGRVVVRRQQDGRKARAPSGRPGVLQAAAASADQRAYSDSRSAPRSSSSTLDYTGGSSIVNSVSSGLFSFFCTYASKRRGGIVENARTRESRAPVGGTTPTHAPAGRSIQDARPRSKKGGGRRSRPSVSVRSCSLHAFCGLGTFLSFSPFFLCRLWLKV